MMYHSNNNNLTAYRHNRHNGFTLIEMVAAIGVLTVILSFVMVAINNCIMATIDSQSKMEAFQIARENMETLLSKNSIEEDVEFGVSEINPDIEWQTAIESFYEPITSRMWIQAVCSASYTDSSDERQEVELTHWITDLSKADIKKILDQMQKEQEMLEEGNPYGNDPEGLMKYADSLAARGNFDAANILLDEIRTEHPGSPEAETIPEWEGQTGGGPTDPTEKPEEPRNDLQDAIGLIETMKKVGWTEDMMRGLISALYPDIAEEAFRQAL